MPRDKGIAWKFVEKLEGDKWRCPYCGKVSQSVTRVKGHIQKTPGKGIVPCDIAPDCIGELMKWLPKQVPYPNKEDIAWKLVERQLGDDKWCCHHCKKEFFGDATAVKCHLLRGSSGGISICTKVPDTIRKLMMSLLEEAAEEEGREANVQSSTEPGQQVICQPGNTTAPACPPDPVSNMPLDNLVTTRQSDLSNHENEINSSLSIPPDPNITQDHIWTELPSLPNDHVPGDITSNRQRELHGADRSIHSPNSSFFSDLQVENLQSYNNYSQPCRAEVVPERGNISQTNPIQHPHRSSTEPGHPVICQPGNTTASACPPDQVSSLAGNTPLENLGTAQQPNSSNHSLDAECVSSSLSITSDPSEPPEHLQGSTPRETGNKEQNSREQASFLNDLILGNSTSDGQWVHGGDSPIFSLGCSVLGVIQFDDPEYNDRPRIIDELPNPTAGSSLQNDSSVDVNSTKRLQDCSQPCRAEVAPERGNISQTNPIQHPHQLHPMRDKEDGNNIHSFASPTPMDLDPSTASQQTSDSHNFEPRAVDFQVSEAATHTRGRSSSSQGASSFQNDRASVRHSNEPLPSCDEERETETSLSPLRESMERCSPTATHVDSQFLEGEANMVGPSSSQEINEGQIRRELPSYPNDHVLGNGTSNGQCEHQGGDSLIYSQSFSSPDDSPLVDPKHIDQLMNILGGILKDSTVGSSSQNDSSHDVNSTKRLQDYSQPCGAEVVLERGNISQTNLVQHPHQLHPRHLDPSIVSQQTSNSHNFEPRAVDLQVSEAARNARGRSSSSQGKGQSSTELQSHDLPGEAQARMAEEESGEGNGRFSMEPHSHDMLTQVVVAEEERREAHTEPRSCDKTSSMTIVMNESLGRITPPGAAHRSNFNQRDVIGLNSGQQSQAECQFHQRSTMPSTVQNSHGEGMSYSGEEECYLRTSPYHEERQMNDQQTPAGELSSQCEQSRAVGNSNCLQDCNRHPQLQTPMDTDPSIASPHASDPHYSEAIAVDLQVSEPATNAIGLSSSQDICCVQVLPSLSQAPNNAPPPPIPPRGTGVIGPSPELDMNEGAPMASHANTGDNFEENRALKRKLKNVRSRVADIRAELEFAASMSVKKHRREVGNWLPDAEKFIEDCTEAASKDCLPPQEVNRLKRKSEDLLRRGKFPKGLFEARETKVSKFLEGKMVGEAFKRNTTKILEYLVGNQVSRLGICGMGGVGKTTIMKHIHNRLLEKANYGNVLWITVSKDFNTHKLQDDIWKALGLDTLQETDVIKRAAMLHDHLMKRGKCTLILDDVWEHFDLEELGIPIREDGFQLALTTRSFYVCHQMQCQENIKIEPLSQEEAESLFLEEHGSEVALSLEIKAVVKSIVEECAGLPLGVITIARSMRGVTQLFIWKDFLVKLKESSVGQTDMEKKVLMKLKFSYDRLGNHQVQQCFLSCALYPEDELIGKLELIELLIDQGLIGGLDKREQQYDRGLTILSILENVCLLEDHGSKMKMHDLIRDMALHIIGATSMVKARKQLTRIPSEECWTDALERVSLMDNCIGEFPLNMSPNCPKLSTLLLNTSLGQVNVIPDSFFQKLRGLEVLNLSWCEDLTELPNSISDLVNLRALLLRECFELHHIPSVAKLTSLRKLDARGCHRLEEIEGLEMLVSLRYLDISGRSINSLPKETFRRLLKLQYLKVRAPIEVDITYLGALETLECCFGDANDFNECVRVIGQRDNCRYDLTVNPLKSFYRRRPERSRYGEDPIFNLDKIIAIEEWSHAIVSVGGECAGNFILIPRDVQKLTMRNCGGITNLAGMDPLKCLEELIIEGEEDLRVLWGGQDEEGIDIRDSPATIPSPPLFPSLRRLEISFCWSLKHLIGYGSNFPLPHLREIHIRHCCEMEGIMATVASPPPCPNPAFPSLEKIEVCFCGEMKRVVESEWLPHFPNLREIAVESCWDMEEIIGGPPPNMTVGEIPLESLEVKGCHKMRMLITHEWLIHLRNLQRIRVDGCRGMVEMISSGAGQSQEGSTRSEAGQSQGGSIMTPVTDTSSRSSISLPKLTLLQLWDLPRLQSICEVSITCDSIEYIKVGKCPELKGIPLLLRLRDIEDLPYIWVDDEETWKMLTWDCPNAQAVLQPHLRKEEEANKSSGMSPTTIELPGKKKDLEWRFW